MPQQRLAPLFLFALLFCAAMPAAALQVTFPLDISTGDTRPRVSTLKPSSLKEFFDRFDMNYQGDFYRTGTYGDRSRAFRPDNLYLVHGLTLGATSKMKNGLDYEVRLSLRSVTDPTISFRDDVHINSFYSQLGRKDVWKLRGGDLFPNLSRYTLNRFVKGVQGEYEREMGPSRMRSIAILSRIERARELNTLRRVAMGTGISFESLNKDRGKPKWFMGYRNSTASDQLGSIDNTRTIPDLQVSTHGLLYSAQLPLGWQFLGENAWSNGTADRRTTRERNGSAWLADLAWIRSATAARAGLARLAPIAFRFNWEMVDPYFLAPLGSANPNSLRWTGRTDHRFNENLDWYMSFLRIEDNVRDQVATTNVTRNSNLTVNMRPFMLFGASPNWTEKIPESVREIKTKLEFRFNDRDASNNSVNAKIEDYIYTVTYKLLDINFTGDYQFQITDDDAAPTNDRRIQAYGIRAAKPLNWKKMGVRLFPSVGYRVQRDRFRLTGAATYQQTTTLGTSVNWEEIAATFNYLILDADRAPGGSDYMQHKFNMGLTYKPYLIPNFESVISYGYLDQDEENSLRSYRQMETRLTMKYKF